MLLIGSPRIHELRKVLENYSEDGASFQIVKTEGLNITVMHNLEDDTVAKNLIKQLVNSSPKLKPYFVSVKIVDENGNLI